MSFSGLISRFGDCLEPQCLKHTEVHIKIFKILRIHFVSRFLFTMWGILLEALALTSSAPISITYLLLEEPFQFQSEIFKAPVSNYDFHKQPGRWAIFMNGTLRNKIFIVIVSLNEFKKSLESSWKIGRVRCVGLKHVCGSRILFSVRKYNTECVRLERHLIKTNGLFARDTASSTKGGVQCRSRENLRYLSIVS